MPINFSFVSFRQNSIHRIAPVLLVASGLVFLICGSVYAIGRRASRYEFKGIVKTVNRSKRLAMIKHEEVKDLMSAMTMPFLIKDAKALQQLQPGDQINATLVVTKSGAHWLEHVVITAKTSAGEPKMDRTSGGTP